LLAVFLVAEAGGEASGDFGGERAELRDDDGFLPGLLDRVHAGPGQLASRVTLFAGLLKADLGVAAEPHLAGVARPHEAENPLLRPVGRDGQLKAAPVAIFARLRGFDFTCRQRHFAARHLSAGDKSAHKFG
jgi:hypothetical protein